VWTIRLSTGHAEGTPGLTNLQEYGPNPDSQCLGGGTRLIKTPGKYTYG